MEYWQGAARWVNVTLVAVLSLLSVDALLYLLGWRTANVIAALLHAVAGVLSAPFSGLWAGQHPLAALALAALGYLLLACVVLATVMAARLRASTTEAAAAGAVGGWPAEHDQVSV